MTKRTESIETARAEARRAVAALFQDLQGDRDGHDPYARLVCWGEENPEAFEAIVAKVHAAVVSQ